MADTQIMTVNPGWQDSQKIAASGKTAVVIDNRFVQEIDWAVTSTDTAPSFAPGQGHRLDRQVSLTLTDGERLWLATDNGTLSATITAGAA